jgi:hypothetical protein
MRALVAFTLLLSACASVPPRGDAQQPATVVGHERPAAVESVRAAIRAEAQRLYGAECGRVTLPDRAFEPVEVTGGGPPEYAVLLGRGVCERIGNSQIWQGTGGAVVQIWLASGGPPRMLLEHQMHGFNPGPRSLLSLQHGAFCPGGAGPGVCLVAYEWNERDRTLEVAHRQPFDDQHPGRPPTMGFDYETISR